MISGNLVEALRQGRPFVEQDDRSAEDFTYVDDAVAATLAAARAPRAAGRVINVGSGQMVAISDVLSILSQLVRVPVRTGFPRTLETPVYRMCAETTLASELLEFVPRVSLVAGLARVVNALEAQPERAALAPVGSDD